jgi:hypothetical protein
VDRNARDDDLSSNCVPKKTPSQGLRLTARYARQQRSEAHGE